MTRYEVKNITPPQSIKDAMEKQMRAVREKRAVIAESEGQKQAKINVADGDKEELIRRSEGEKMKRINEAEGDRQELIARSEGEKQKRVNEAEGQAAEIRLVAEATAQGIRQVAEALQISKLPILKVVEALTILL